MRKLVRVAALQGLLVLITLAMSGCYLMQAGKGQIALLSKRESIDKVIAQPHTEPALRKRLQLLAEAREFAVNELHLPDNKSYRSYADLKRDYAVWNVFATPAFSVEPVQWCFPIAGCVVYRGYFHERAAQRYALRARMRGDDASVSGAAAYSTLGHFNDPIVSPMMRWNDAQLIATLFHELAHQVAYAPGDSVFNESFASVVEDAGIERWLNVRDETSALRNWHLAGDRSREFSQLLLAARDRLKVLYKSDLDPRAMAYRKQLEFGQLKFEYWQLKARWNGYDGYDHWFDRALSNADLVPIATYDSCMPALQTLLHSVNDEWPRFYAAVQRLAKGPAEGRRKVCGG